MGEPTPPKARGLYSRPRFIAKPIEVPSCGFFDAGNTRESMADETLAEIAKSLARIADRLDAMAPASGGTGPVFGTENAYHWDAAAGRLLPVPNVARVPFGLLKGIDGV